AQDDEPRPLLAARAPAQRERHAARAQRPAERAAHVEAAAPADAGAERRLRAQLARQPRDLLAQPADLVLGERGGPPFRERAQAQVLHPLAVLLLELVLHVVAHR